MQSPPSPAWTRAQAAFSKDEQMRDRALAVIEYEARALALRERTAQLRALRLAREASGTAPKAAAPKAVVGSTNSVTKRGRKLPRQSSVRQV